MSWKKAVLNKRNGGLGIGSLRNKNAALLLIWWWTFGKEKNALWRKVVLHKYNLESSCWFSSNGSRLKPSVVWNDITDGIRIMCRDHNPGRMDEWVILILSLFILECLIYQIRRMH